MEISIDESGRHIVLKKVYSGIMLETEEGNRIGICMRDDTFEINILPKGAKASNWHRVEMDSESIRTMPSRSGRGASSTSR